MGAWDEQIPVEGLGTSVDPLAAFTRRRKLSEALYNTGETGDVAGGETAANMAPAPDMVRHRIVDDMNTAGSKSGGPGGDYSDPGQGHLRDLITQQDKMNQPQPKPGIKNRLLQALTDAGPTALASAMGSAGGVVGADQRMQQGVKRRQQTADIDSQRRNDAAVKLKSDIEAEQRAEEQRTFQHGEDKMRQETAERGMNERSRIQQEMETGRNERLAKTIESREGMQQDKFGHDTEMEDQKQKGRMQLQMARRNAQEAVARIHAAAAGAKIPPMVAKAADTFEDSQSRMNVMQKAYDDAMRDPGNQQAQLNLLANHLGMTMGLQKGARINQHMIDEAKSSGYLDERIEAHFGPDGYMTGVVLTPRQMGQMVGLAGDRLLEDSRKVTDMEGYFGVQGKTALKPRIPGSGGAGPTAPGTAGAGGGGAGAASNQGSSQLKPPSEASQGMHWQHRIVNGKVEWRMVQDKQQ